MRGDEYRLWVFHGPHQNKFTAEMVVAWQPLGDRVQFIQSSKNGKNALDFHIAFCLGQVYQQDVAAKRAAQYIVISKDGGFDALFDYIRSLGGTVGRAASIPEALTLASQVPRTVPDPGGESQSLAKDRAPLNGVALKTQALEKPRAKKVVKKSAKKASSQSKAKTSSALEKVLAHLRANPKSRPTTEKSLKNHIPSMVGGSVSKEMVKVLMTTLEKDEITIMKDKKIEYKIPKAKKTGKGIMARK